MTVNWCQKHQKKKTIPLKIYESKPLIWLSTASRSDRKEERISDSYRNICEAKLIFEQLLKIDEELGELKLKKKQLLLLDIEVREISLQDYTKVAIKQDSIICLLKSIQLMLFKVERQTLFSIV